MYLSIIVHPLSGSIVSGFFGRKVGVSGSQIITCSSVVITTLLSLIAFYEVGLNNIPVSLQLFRWIDSESLYVSLGFHFGALTVSMLMPVLIVSSLVHVYSIGYMSHDPHNQRFFSYLSLLFMMIVLVSANSFLLMFALVFLLMRSINSINFKFEFLNNVPILQRLFVKPMHWWVIPSIISIYVMLIIILICMTMSVWDIYIILNNISPPADISLLYLPFMVKKYKSKKSPFNKMKNYRDYICIFLLPWYPKIVKILIIFLTLYTLINITFLLSGDIIYCMSPLDHAKDLVAYYQDELVGSTNMLKTYPDDSQLSPDELKNKADVIQAIKDNREALRSLLGDLDKLRSEYNTAEGSNSQSSGKRTFSEVSDKTDGSGNTKRTR